MSWFNYRKDLTELLQFQCIIELCSNHMERWKLRKWNDIFAKFWVKHRNETSLYSNLCSQFESGKNVWKTITKKKFKTLHSYILSHIAYTVSIEADPNSMFSIWDFCTKNWCVSNCIILRRRVQGIYCPSNVVRIAMISIWKTMNEFQKESDYHLVMLPFSNRKISK